MDDVWVVGGRLYIGFNTQVERNEEVNSGLEMLWDSKSNVDFVDEWGQDNKLFDIALLEEIFGKVQPHFLIMHPEFGKLDRKSKKWCVGRYPDYCTEPLVGLTFSRRQPERALIFEWGCVDELIPVLDLGEVQAEHASGRWYFVALGSAMPLPMPVLSERYPQEQLPANVLNYFHYKSNFGVDGFTLEFNQSTQYGLEHSVGYGQVPEFWILENLKSTDKSIQIIKTGSVTDNC